LKKGILSNEECNDFIVEAKRGNNARFPEHVTVIGDYECTNRFNDYPQCVLIYISVRCTFVLFLLVFSTNISGLSPFVDRCSAPLYW